MRPIELADNGVATLKLAVIAAGGAVLWLGWLLRSVAHDVAERLRKGSLALVHVTLRHDRRHRGERSGSLDELERLRQNGAI